MGETFIMQLPSIIFAAAALVASLATLINVVKGHAKLEANNSKLTEIGNKVDGGLNAMQKALADIAINAQAAAALAGKQTIVVKEGQRSTDTKRE